jgi:hypothetical protein
MVCCPARFSDDKDPNPYVPEKQGGSVRSDLKWGKKEAVTKAARDFITQLCMQALLELVCEGAESIRIRRARTARQLRDPEASPMSNVQPRTRKNASAIAT